MYALEMLLVACGILAFQRALEAPTLGRARAVRRCSSRCCSTRSTGRSISCSSWSSLLVVARCGEGRYRDAARRAAHRAGDRRARASFRGCRRSCTSARTPARRGARRCCPAIPLGYTLRDFAGGATASDVDRARGMAAVPRRFAVCCCSACSDGPSTTGALEIDIRTQPRGPVRHVRRSARGARRRARRSTISPAARSSRGTARSCSRSSCCSSRAASASAARSAYPRARSSPSWCVLGFAGGVRNVVDAAHAGRRRSPRCSRAEAKPGDLVVYCPDQLGAGRAPARRRRASTRSCIRASRARA